MNDLDCGLPSRLEHELALELELLNMRARLDYGDGHRLRLRDRIPEGRRKGRLFLNSAPESQIAEPPVYTFGDFSNMSKLQAIADRLKDMHRKLDEEADKLAAKMDGVDAKAPAAFDRGHAFVAEKAADVDAIDATLRQLTNFPLEGSQG